MERPTLFSGLLSSLNQMAEVDQSSPPSEIKLDNETAVLEYSEDNCVAKMHIDDMTLLFHYAKGDDFTIAGSMRESVKEDYDIDQVLVRLLNQVEAYMDAYDDVDWQSVPKALLLEMEAGLLDTVIYPFFDRYDIDNNCPLGDNCPYRLALYEGEGITIMDKLRHKVEKIKQSSIFHKIKLKLFPTKHKLPS